MVNTNNITDVFQKQLILDHSYQDLAAQYITNCIQINVLVMIAKQNYISEKMNNKDFIRHIFKLDNKTDDQLSTYLSSIKSSEGLQKNSGLYNDKFLKDK